MVVDRSFKRVVKSERLWLLAHLSSIHEYQVSSADERINRILRNNHNLKTTPDRWIPLNHGWSSLFARNSWNAG